MFCLPLSLLLVLLQHATAAIVLGGTPLTATDLHSGCVVVLQTPFYDVVASNTGIAFIAASANDTTGVQVGRSTIGKH